MKEAARTSVVSRRWNHLWRCFPILIFEDNSAVKRMSDEDVYLPEERSVFLRWVNRVVKAHLGPTVDELRVIFSFDKNCQSHMDKWLVFALAKQVKRLEFDYTPLLPGKYTPSLPKWNISIDQLPNLAVFKFCLRSLCLKFVNINTKDIDCLLRSCMVLEELCVVSSQTLRHVRASGGSPLQLKRLEVSYCPHLRTVDILAPKLLSFIHHGYPIELHIRNAYLLSEVSVGDTGCREDVVAYAFDSLSKYFSQLEYLSWHIQLYFGGYTHRIELNLGINNPPAMTNLKHLELQVFAMSDQSLLGWAHLIEASPSLQRLTLVTQMYSGRPSKNILKRSGRPLKSLKTLELYGDVGVPIDLEFATYVIENSIMLKEVIVVFRPLLHPVSEYTSVEDQFANIKRIVPQGVKLTLKMVDKYVKPWEIKRPQEEGL